MAGRPFPARSPRVSLAATLLLLAWMPSLLFFGHWTELAAPSPHHAMTVAAHHDSGVPTDKSQHAQHCHGSSTCAGGGASASAVDFVTANPLALASQPLEVGTVATSSAPVAGRSNAAPDAPPPRMAA